MKTRTLSSFFYKQLDVGTKLCPIDNLSIDNLYMKSYGQEI